MFLFTAKMTYLRQNKRIDPSKKRTRRIVVSLVVFALLAGFVFPRAIGRALHVVFSPVWKIEIGMASWAIGKAKLVQSKADLTRENEALKKESALYKVTAMELAQIREENTALKEMLGRPKKGNPVLGVVLRRPPLSPYDTLVLDIGFSDGVRVGDLVTGQDSLTLGTVKEVLESGSIVELLSFPNRETEVLVGVKNVPAKAVGLGGGNFKMELPVEVSVSVGDSVRMPGINSTIMGIIGDVVVDASGSVASVLLKAPYNMNDLSFVEVISSADEKKDNR